MLKKYKTIQVLIALSLGLIGFNATALNIDGMSPSELFELGENYESIGNINKSFLYFDKAAQDKYVPAMLKLVTIFQEEGRHQQASQILDEAAGMGDPTALYEKATKVCKLRTKKVYQECINLLSSAGLKGNANAYRKLAELRKDDKKSYQDSLKAYAIDEISIGIFHYGHKSGYSEDKILDDIRKILEKKGDGSADIARKLGEILYREGYTVVGDMATDLRKIKKSYRLFDQAIKLDPKYKELNGTIAEFEAYGYEGKQNWDSVFSHLKLAAEVNPTRFNDSFAFLYYYGLGTEQDTSKVLSLSSASNDLSFIAYLYAKGSGVKQDLAKWVTLELEDYAIDRINTYRSSYFQQLNQKKFEAYAKLGKSDSVETLFSKGVLLLQKEKYNQSLAYLEKAANAGNDKAIELVLSLYARGLGCKKDYKKAFEWGSKIDEEYSTVRKLIGINYLYGINEFDKNPTKARDFIRGASYKFINLTEDVPLDLKLKILLLPQEEILKRGLRIKDENLNINQAQEAYFFLRAAAEKSGEACNLLGELHLKNFSIESAKKYFEKSLSLGYEEANKNLGYMYLNGYGALPDIQKALEFYSKNTTKHKAFYQMSLNLEGYSYYTDPLSIWFLYKSVNDDPSFAEAWRALFRKDPRRGDDQYRLRMLEQACTASSDEKSTFCKEYKSVRSGKGCIFR